jgi:hypothetical protein
MTSKYPTDEGEMRMNQAHAIEVAVVSASMSKRKPELKGK